MGMPVTVEVVDEKATEKTLEKVFDYFKYIDEKFSTYKKTSEISMINRGELALEKCSQDMKTILWLAEKTKRETEGFFDINRGYRRDPSGIVKGWAIWQAAKILEGMGHVNYYVDAGGDIQTSGKNAEGKPWKVGIRNPQRKEEIVKVFAVSGEGIATSGNYERGLHILNPKTGMPADEIASMTVIGPNVYEADRFVTAAFAMGRGGIIFIEKRGGLEGYMIDKEGMATKTSGIGKYETA